MNDTNSNLKSPAGGRPSEALSPDNQDMAPMEINPDRPARMRSLAVFAIFFLAVAGVFAWLLLKFTGSRLIAFGLAFGMITYMLVMAACTARNLRRPGE